MDCNICGERFTNEGDLKLHKSNEHKTFNELYAQEDHTTNYEEGEKYKCETCGDKFDNHKDAVSHAMSGHTVNAEADDNKKIIYIKPFGGIDAREGLNSQQKAILNRYVASNKDNIGIFWKLEDELPYDIYDKLQELGDSETLYQDITNYVTDKADESFSGEDDRVSDFWGDKKNFEVDDDEYFKTGRIVSKQPKDKRTQESIGSHWLTVDVEDKMKIFESLGLPQGEAYELLYLPWSSLSHEFQNAIETRYGVEEEEDKEEDETEEDELYGESYNLEKNHQSPDFKKKVSCEHCNLVFENKSLLSTHINDLHTPFLSNEFKAGPYDYKENVETWWNEMPPFQRQGAAYAGAGVYGEDGIGNKTWDEISPHNQQKIRKHWESKKIYAESYSKEHDEKLWDTWTPDERHHRMFQAGLDPFMYSAHKTESWDELPLWLKKYLESHESYAREVSIDDFRRIVDNHQHEKIRFDDGTVDVDAFTASAVTQVFDAIKNNEEAINKFDRMIQTSYGVQKIANLAFRSGESFAKEANIERGDRKMTINGKEVQKIWESMQGWYWYGVEKVDSDTWYGYVQGFENEWGYFSESELKQNHVWEVPRSNWSYTGKESFANESRRSDMWNGMSVSDRKEMLQNLSHGFFAQYHQDAVKQIKNNVDAIASLDFDSLSGDVLQLVHDHFQNITESFVGKESTTWLVSTIFSGKFNVQMGDMATKDDVIEQVKRMGNLQANDEILGVDKIGEVESPDKPNLDKYKKHPLFNIPTESLYDKEEE